MKWDRVFFRSLGWEISVESEETATNTLGFGILEIVYSQQQAAPSHNIAAKQQRNQ